MKIIEILTEGGNAFPGMATPINKENIVPTLTRYFTELARLFPPKKNIFNTKNFELLGSAGKKAISGDLDLGIAPQNLLDGQLSDKAIREWGIDPSEIQSEITSMRSTTKGRTEPQLRIKAFLKVLCRNINENSHSIQCSGRMTYGNVYTIFKQGDKWTQIDWMVGDPAWLKFSHYSAAYPEGSKIKGMHRSQLLTSLFKAVGYSFSNISGVTDRTTGKTIATTPEDAMRVLSQRIGFQVSVPKTNDFGTLYKLLKDNLNPEVYQSMIDDYIDVLNRKGAYIPEIIQKR